jgi:hypothetical protein
MRRKASWQAYEGMADIMSIGDSRTKAAARMTATPCPLTCNHNNPAKSDKRKMADVT